MTALRCCKRNGYDAGWCDTCWYRAACEAKQENPPADPARRVCACDQKGAQGVCSWRAKYERRKLRPPAQEEAVKVISQIVYRISLGADMRIASRTNLAIYTDRQPSCRED